MNKVFWREAYKTVFQVFDKSRKKIRMKSMVKFKSGQVVVFDPASFNPAFWDKLSEEDRIKYYGPLGYGSKKPKLFIYMCEINDSGHCVLIDMDTSENVIMRHTSDFKPATDEEF